MLPLQRQTIIVGETVVFEVSQAVLVCLPMLPHRAPGVEFSLRATNQAALSAYHWRLVLMERVFFFHRAQNNLVRYIYPEKTRLIVLKSKTILPKYIVTTKL